MPPLIKLTGTLVLFYYYRVIETATLNAIRCVCTETDALVPCVCAFL